MMFDWVKTNEDDTTSSGRIFRVVKIMIQEMMEGMGLKTLAERFKDPEGLRRHVRAEEYEVRDY